MSETKETIELLLTDRAVLHVGRISALPTEASSRQELSNSIVRTVFDRLPTRRSVPEETLNAALAMFVEDVALVRCDAVDTGVLSRSPDGAAYRSRPGERRCRCTYLRSEPGGEEVIMSALARDWSADDARGPSAIRSVIGCRDPAPTGSGAGVRY